MNKKAITSIVATSLLIIIVVMSITVFQQWFQLFQSNALTEVETKSNYDNSLEIEIIIGNKLYLNSNIEKNISEIKIIDSIGNSCILGSPQEKNNLIGYWNFDNISGNTVYDLSGLGNNGIISGATINNEDPINGNYSEYDDSTDQYIDLGDIDEIGNLNNFSISLWFNADYLPITLNDNNAIFTQFIDYDNYIIIRFDGNSQTLIAGVESGGIYSNAEIYYHGNLTENTWYHLVFTFNSGNSRIYLNKELKKSVLNPSITKSPNLAKNIYLGKIGWTTYDRFKGLIDEVMIFNSTLTESEITDLYNFKYNNIRNYESLKSGINEIDISNCELNSYETYEIIVQTNDEIKSKEIRYE